MFYVPYTLIPVGALSARAAAQPRQGVLLRGENGGFASLQSWPELGDAPLEYELDALRAGHPLKLGARALRCIGKDAEARALSKSMFEGLSVPKSHATLPVSSSPSMVYTLNQRGFRMGKLKLLPNLQAALERLMNLAAMVPEWSWRLDFNATLTRDETLAFWGMLPEALKRRINFIEDPCPYTVDDWQTLQDACIPLAYDIPLTNDAGIPPCTHTPMMRVVKPARDRTTEGLPVFTSYMDHPLGQMWAAWCAAYFYRDTPADQIPLCGLVTQHVYRSNEFSEVLGLSIQPDLAIPLGTGLGFDELLEKQPWKRL